jgi:hypothetical protein
VSTKAERKRQAEERRKAKEKRRRAEKRAEREAETARELNRLRPNLSEAAERKQAEARQRVARGASKLRLKGNMDRGLVNSLEAVKKRRKREERLAQTNKRRIENPASGGLPTLGKGRG